MLHVDTCRDGWVRKGLIVKVMAKELKEQGLYKAKGVITRLPRAAVAEVSTFDPEAVVQVSGTWSSFRSLTKIERLD